MFIDKEVWMWNVFIFTQWIKNVVSLKEEETIWSNLSICLREAVQCWYSDELNDCDKIALHVDFQQWYSALAEWFWKNLMMTIRKLNEVCYICQNILNEITFNSYIACVLCLAEAFYTSDHSALLIIYSNFEAEMRHDVKMFTVSITKKKFIQ